MSRESVTITRFQLECVKLRVSGKSLYEIAAKLHSHPSTVHRALKSIKENYPKLQEFVKEIQKTRYFSRDFSWPEVKERAIRARLERVRRGYHYAGFAPFGYETENGMFVVNSEEAEVVKRIFKDYKEGKSMKQIGEDIGMQREQVRRILWNPTYMGKIRLKGETYPGKHEPIVSEELWKRIQPLMGARPPPRPAPTGYKWKAGRLIVDPETAKKVRQVFELRLKGKHYAEISRRTGIIPATVSYILRNPIYAGKIKADDKLLDGPSEKIVDFETWSRVQLVHTPRLETLTKMRRKQGIETRNKILRDLPGTTAELAKKTGLRPCTLYYWLKRLREQDIVEKRNGKFGKWYIRESVENP